MRVEFWVVMGVALWSAAACADQSGRGPNVVLIITDDQGYGDLGVHDNPVIQTPRLDELARQSVRLTRFYVSPVCAPTRASLMTGRYNYRTGVVDTYIGRAMMHPDEVTLAERLSQAGYRTAIFGKWHLGDNYPLRPIDQGFQEALVHKGGGIGQPSDPPGGESYFDPILQYNGRPKRARGYVSDVITEAALHFIERNREQRFFVYLAFNAPHDPLEVPDEYRERYRNADLDPQRFPSQGQPWAAAEADKTARVYAMVTNIDDNVGRVLDKLAELHLADDTLVVFLTDNGPQHPRYNAGMRGLKGSVYEGGIRVPCFIRWPARLQAGRQIDRIAAHIDLAPTLAEACGLDRPADGELDGRSLLPLLSGKRAGEWPDRTIYLQWHRGDRPEKYRAFAAVSQQFKLVQPKGVAPGSPAGEQSFELYDIEADPYETRDLAGQEAEVERLQAGYEEWFEEMEAERDFAPPRIVLGSEQENPTILTRQDWRGPRAGWAADSLGYWEVQVAEAGQYLVTLRFAAAEGRAHFRLGQVEQSAAVNEAGECMLGPVRLESGPGRLEGWVKLNGGKVGVNYVEVARR